jgi:DNA-binding FadR family transcriptional regulator
MRRAGGDPAAFVGSYASFHEAIAALTENHILSEILRAVTDLLGESPAHTAGRSAVGDRSATVGWCEALYEAIRRGDSQRVGSIMTSAPL